MWLDQGYAEGRGSFLRPVLPPSADPGSSPTKTISINCQWLPYIRGALLQLVLEATWRQPDVDVDLAQARAMTLISLFDECGTSVLPISCDYDFTRHVFDPLGWFLPPPSCGLAGVYLGPSFVSSDRTACGGLYNQLVMARDLNVNDLVVVDILYASTADIACSIYNSVGGVPSFLNSGVFPAGIGLHGIIVVSGAVTTLELVLNNSVTDGSQNVPIEVQAVKIIAENETGVCP